MAQQSEPVHHGPPHAVMQSMSFLSPHLASRGHRLSPARRFRTTGGGLAAAPGCHTIRTKIGARLRHGWNEQIGNHNSLMRPKGNQGGKPTFLINSRGYLFQELTASALIMGGHGVTVIGPTVHDAFDELFIAERTAMYQMTAVASGQKLRMQPDAMRRRWNGPWGDKLDARLHLDAWRHVLDREEPDYAT